MNESLDFGSALDKLKEGLKLQRAGWNGKGQFVAVMPSLSLQPHNCPDNVAKVNARTAKHIGEDTPLMCMPYLALFNAQQQWQPGWVPSQGDLFAEDWQVVE